MKKSSEYENFDRSLRELLKVSHSEIKTKLDEEKQAKKSKPKAKKAASGNK